MFLDKNTTEKIPFTKSFFETCQNNNCPEKSILQKFDFCQEKGYGYWLKWQNVTLLDILNKKYQKNMFFKDLSGKSSFLQ